MTLKEKISADFKQAFKEKDLQKKSVLSMLQSEIKNKEIDLGKKEEGLSDEEVLAVLGRAVKQRKDSIEQYRSGGREELAVQEQSEVEILMAYLPEQISEEEVEKVVKEVIAATGASTKADIGKVMGQAMGRLKGQADGNVVRQKAEQLLS